MKDKITIPSECQQYPDVMIDLKRRNSKEKSPSAYVGCHAGLVREAQLTRRLTSGRSGLPKWGSLLARIPDSYCWHSFRTHDPLNAFHKKLRGTRYVYSVTFEQDRFDMNKQFPFYSQEHAQGIGTQMPPVIFLHDMFSYFWWCYAINNKGSRHSIIT